MLRLHGRRGVRGTALKPQDRPLPLDNTLPGRHRAAVTCSGALGSASSPCNHYKTDVMAALRPEKLHKTLLMEPPLERQTRYVGLRVTRRAVVVKRIPGYSLYPSNQRKRSRRLFPCVSAALSLAPDGSAYVTRLAA